MNLFVHSLADMIKELISRGQQVDAVHFTQEVCLVDMFPPVPLLKAFLKDAKKAATSIMEDPNNSGRAAVFISLYIYKSSFLIFVTCLYSVDHQICSTFPKAIVLTDI